jgi:hypothetical protein
MNRRHWVQGAYATLLSVACGACALESDTGTGDFTAQTAQAVLGVDTHLYLRCNATGWDVNDATRLRPTRDPNLFVLNYDVTQGWMVSGSDNCVFTETNQLNGWGSTSSFYTRSPAGTLNAPGESATVTGATQFAVKYPALGAYRVTFNAQTRKFTIGTAAETWEPTIRRLPTAPVVSSIGYGYGTGCGSITSGLRAAVVGYQNGDVYLSSNADLPRPTWRRVDTWTDPAGGQHDLPNNVVLASAVNPCNAQEAIVGFAGTTQGTKIYRTANGGQTWLQVGIGHEVWGLSYNPLAASRIYAAGPNGVVSYTTDGGATWTTTQPAGDPLLANLPGGATKSISTALVMQNSPGHIWIGTTAGEIWATFDAGATWDRKDDDNLSVGAPPLPARSITHLGTGVINWSPPKVTVSYAGMLNDSAWVTFNRFSPFVNVHKPNLPTTSVVVNSYGVAGISVNPADENVLYAAVAGTYGAAVSTNGGSSWSFFQ